MLPQIIDKPILDFQYQGIDSQQEIVALEYSRGFTHYPSNSNLFMRLFEFEDQKKNIFLNKMRRKSLKEFSNVFFI